MTIALLIKNPGEKRAEGVFFSLSGGQNPPVGGITPVRARASFCRGYRERRATGRDKPIVAQYCGATAARNLGKV